MDSIAISRVMTSAKAERAKAKKAAWEAEVAELRARKAARDAANAGQLPVDGEAGRLVEMLNSDGFKEVYRDLTGKEPDHWLESVLGVSDYVLSAMGVKRYSWILTQVHELAAKYCWGDPAYKEVLGEKLIRSRSKTDKRRFRIRMATPFWANPLKIAAVYRERDRLTEQTGIQHHVDHIVPLIHPRVCGLHCEANLRVITQAENQAKSNLYYIA